VDDVVRFPDASVDVRKRWDSVKVWSYAWWRWSRAASVRRSGWSLAPPRELDTTASSVVCSSFTPFPFLFLLPPPRWLCFHPHLFVVCLLVNRITQKLLSNSAPCGLRGCQNWPAPFPGRMYILAYFIVLLFIRAPFYVLSVFVAVFCLLVVLAKLSLLPKW